VRSGELYLSNLGTHGSYEQWENSGSPDLLSEIRENARDLLSKKQPIPLPEAAKRELENLERRARAGE
jgi:trimethylamine:corrinoid methyltransferase-like protein